MFGFITRFFGNKKDKDVAALKPLVAQINQQYESLRPLSDDQLRNKSREFKKKIKEAYASLDAQMDKWTAEIKTLDVVNQESIFEQIDKLKKEKNKVIEEALMNILPEAFAVVKETSRRLTENKQLVVTATEWDQLIASRKANVQIQDGKAIWLNQWTAAGAQIEWNMIHYDVQLIGGMALHQGKISEMATGEGKTLVATLPTYLNALAGQGVHIVTVNDYLARRDCEWNAPIFEFHELSVDVIDIHKPNSDTRKNAYLADITYGTNNEFGFDYLRDNMVTHPDHLVQRQLHYAIVDEVDSILIDDARTPLIIAGPAPQGDRHEFDILRPRIEAIVEEQRKLVNQCLSEAKKLIANGEQDKGGVQLLRAHRGLPRHSALLRYQNEPGIKVLLQKTENYYMQDNSKNMYKIDDELFFVMDEKNNQVELTDKGRDMITLAGEDPNLFVLPDLANLLSEIEVDTHISPEEKYHQKDMLFRNYAEKSERLHSIHQLLKAYCLFEINKQYVVMEGKVMIVDEGTGRILDGRRYSDGLHQAIEAKERVKIEAATQTFATVTLQNYFRMYHKLAGMTGTAETEAKEFWDIYKLDVVSIPTNKPILRKDLDDKVYKTRKEKFNAIVQEVQELRAKGRPILVGTTDVEVSEYLSKVFTAHKIPHNLLNAKHHQKEAEIVAQAGQAGMVTIATNMAGRGTDIKLGDGVREAGGLAIIGSERHESRRVDRQLRGRSGRQGDPGSSQFFVSLEDNLMRQFGSERIAKVMDWLKVKEGEVIQHSMITKSITNSQRKVEENNFSMRKRLLEYDDVMNYQRETIYGRRRNALFGERLQLDIDNMLWDLSATLVAKYYAEGEPAGLNYDCIRYLAVDPGITEKEMDATKQDAMTNKVYTLARQKYDKSMTELAGMVYHASENLYKHLHSQYHTDPNFEDNLSSVVVEVRLSDGQKTANVGVDLRSILDSQGNAAPMLFEKTVILGIIDEEYKDHLRTMDDLRQSVQNAVYEQKDPLLVYKFESNQIFNNLLYEINTAALAFLMKAQMVTHAEPETHAPIVEERDDFSKLKTSHPDTPTQYTYEYVESNKSKPTHIQEEDDDFNDDFEMEDSEESVDGKNLSRRERRELERKNKKKK